MPEPWVPGQFAGAAVFAFSSPYEGFGFQLVLAMAAGVATIPSHIRAGWVPNFPSQAGGGANGTAGTAARFKPPNILRKLQAVSGSLASTKSKRSGMFGGFWCIMRMV